MAERGSSKHGPILDEKMQQETRGLRNAGQSPHVEDWRETEPVPDETDSPEVQEAFGGGLDAGRTVDGEGDSLADSPADLDDSEAGEEP